MESKLHRRIRVWMDHHQKECYIALAVFLCLVLGIILYFLLRPNEPEPVVEIPHTETAPYNPVVVQQDEPKEINWPMPKGRDTYIHISSVPGDGLYEQIEESKPSLEKDIDHEILAKLCSYVKDQQSYEDVEFIFEHSTDTSYICWLLYDDYYWRLKYFNEDQKITADGEMKDFWYEKFTNWDDIYQEIPDNLKSISLDVAASMTSKIMQQYPYDNFNGITGPWYWDSDDRTNYNLYTDSYLLSNVKYKDTWIVEYIAGEYICMYRQIADVVQEEE